MKIEQNEYGTWDVIDGAGNVLATLASNEDAWRWLDRQNNDHWSPVACRHDWGFWKSAESQKR